MPQSRTKYQFYQESSLSQKLAHKMPEYSQYAGTDPKTSIALSRLKIFADHKIIDPTNPAIKLVIDLLNEKRKAIFATSERVNEITKMGLQMPKAEDEFYGKDPDT